MSERLLHGKMYSMLEDERCYCGLAWPCPDAEPAPPLPKESQDAPKKRECNRHDDCDAADVTAKAAGRFSAEHCRDECCEECFGY